MAKDTNPSKKGEVVKVSKTSLPSWELVLAGWLARFQDHYRQRLSQISIDVYKELLRDLNTAELDAACREAMTTSEFMPNVATIRNALRSLRSIEVTPRTFIRFADVNPEDRIYTAEDQKRIDDMKVKLGILEDQKRIEPQRKTPANRRVSSIEQQKAELRRRGFLK